MRILRIVKAPWILMLLLVLLCLYLFLHQSSTATEDMDIEGHTKNSKSRNLVQVLKRVAMPDNSIILTMLNKEWATPGSIFDLFLESFEIGQRTKHLLNHLLVVSTDVQPYQYCKLLHPHCFHIDTFRKTKKYATMGQLTQIHELLLEIVEFGYSIIFTEADVLWLRTPIPHLDSSKTFITGCESYSKNYIDPDIGFIFVKSDAYSIMFFQYWKVFRVLYPGIDDRSLFKTLVYDKDKFSAYANTAFGGLCHLYTNTTELSTVHVNCCSKIEDKVHDMKLVLDHWRNFTSHSVQSANLELSPSSLEASLRCLSSKRTLNR